MEETFFSVFDQLAFQDCLHSIAYGLILKSHGRLSEEEFAILHAALNEFLLLISNGELESMISPEQTIRTIDHYLYQRDERTAKKLNEDRPMRERLQLDIQLVIRSRLLDILNKIVVLVALLYTRNERALANALVDEIEILKSLYLFVEQLPPAMTSQDELADYLGLYFSSGPLLYSQRSKIEILVLTALVQIVQDLDSWTTQHNQKIFTDNEINRAEIVTACLYQSLKATKVFPLKNADSSPIIRPILVAMTTTIELLNKILNYFLVPSVPKQTTLNELDPIHKRFLDLRQWHKEKFHSWKQKQKNLLS